MTSETRTAIVTGAYGGIGRAITEVLLEEGFAVTMVGRDPDRLRTAADLLAPANGADLRWLAGSLADEGFLDEVALVGESHGSLDLLVNNAGMAGTRAVGELTAEFVDEQFAVNTRAVILLTTKCLPLLRNAVGERGSAQVVNTASNAGKRGEAMLSSYSASKAAVVGFTEALHDELAGEGIKATAICPGLTDTPMADDYREGGAVEMITPRDVAETVRLTTRLSRACVIPEIVLLRPTEWVAASELR
ncbi:SDR family oxidoreductase [Mycobacterium hodleri]|uniref:SDR family NAD(P)-dependent oxidoreductase n=1 Tax=Mycolicibacterium hodleri TaxID=49897 RepID=UPI0021F3A0AE|nr:SDR family oxidoreductase [Mycolicibacterium hodleri]MCV7131567.1 SDR family oxidoreductase [Mycolicibacterium hodleri]